ncbi:hypothetical protein T492DRAFT_842243 [Pavlovales sp. CCMP2436]|nr:hypothetical protein T492DRAFT_842243 [Pavlovales sp. CCMP2436]
MAPASASASSSSSSSPSPLVAAGALPPVAYPTAATAAAAAFPSSSPSAAAAAIASPTAASGTLALASESETGSSGGERGALVCAEGVFSPFSGGMEGGRPSERNGMSLHAVRDASALAIVGGGIFRESGGEYFNDLWLLHLQCTPRLPSPQPEGLFALASKGVSAGASAIVVPRAEGEVHFTALHSTSSTASREGDFAPGCAEKGGDTCTPPCADVSLKGDVFLKGDVLFELECGERGIHACIILLLLLYKTAEKEVLVNLLPYYNS